jgi:uncharacterized membrane protein YhfC
MVSKLLGIVFIVSGFLEIIIPIILGLYIIRKFGTSWRNWFVGALMFILSLIRLPLNAFATQLVVSSSTGSLTYILVLLIPVLAAGVFEETARYVGLKYIIKNDTYETGLTYGAGHGGIESILLVGFNVLFVGIFILSKPQLLSPVLIQALNVMPTYFPLIGVYERLIAMTAQIGFSLMVMISIKNNDLRYFILAIGLHAFFDYLAIAVVDYSIVASEMLLTVFVLGQGYWLSRIIKTESIK